MEDREEDVLVAHVQVDDQQLQVESHKHQLPSPVSLNEMIIFLQNGDIEGRNRQKGILLTSRIIAGVPFPVSGDLLSDFENDDPSP